MYYLQSSKTCPVKMKLLSVLTCFYLASHLLQEIDAGQTCGQQVYPLDQNSVSLGSLDTKKYKENGETLLCLKRDISEACPPDHDIGACHSNLTLVTCKPCDTRNGYRLCMQVYSDIDYLKCYKPSLDCTEEEELIIHKDSYGRCFNTTCVCKASEGYVKQGLECVRLKNKCAVNYSVIDGKCHPCPEGTHKPTVGFEPCSPIPVLTTKPSEQSTRTTAEMVANSTVNVTGSVKENQKSSDGSYLRNLFNIIPAVVCLVAVAVMVLVSCKRNKAGIRCYCRYSCCCSSISNSQRADTSSPRALGQGEITCEGSDHEERPSSPPTYHSSDVPAKNRTRYTSDLNSVVSHRDSKSDTDEVTQPFIPPTEPADQTVNPPAAITQDWPTLVTNGGSSLLPNRATGRPTNETDPRGTLLQLDNTHCPAYASPANVPNVPAEFEAGVDADASADAPTAVADGDSPTADAVADAATCPNPRTAASGFPELGDSLKHYDFGSNFSVIS